MGKTIGVFDYTIAKMNKSDSYPFDPILHMCLQAWSRSEDGPPTITPQLMSEGEIDWYIEALKRDLDAAGQRAKAALTRAKQSTQKIVSDRRTS